MNTLCMGGSGGGGGGVYVVVTPPKPWRPTMNSAQELKFIVQYMCSVEYNVSAKRKQAYRVRGTVEPRGATPSHQLEDGTGSCVFTYIANNGFRNATN